MRTLGEALEQDETRTVPVYVGGRVIGYTTAGTRARIDADPVIQREIEADFAGLCRSFPHLFRRA